MKQIQYLPSATFHPGDKLLLLLGGEPMTIDPAEAKTTSLTAHKLPPLSVFDSETQKDRGVGFTVCQVMISAGIKYRDYIYNKSTMANLSVLSLTLTMAFESSVKYLLLNI